MTTSYRNTFYIFVGIIILFTSYSSNGFAQQVPLISTDTFNGTNGDKLSVYSPSNWSGVGTGGGDFSDLIKIAGSPGAGNFGAVQNIGATYPDDQYAQDVVDSTNFVDSIFGVWWLMLRMNATGSALNGYACGILPTVYGTFNYRIGEYITSGYYNLETSPIIMAHTDVVNCQIVDKLIILRVNGNILLSHNTNLDSIQFSSGNPGIKLSSALSSSLPLVHNFIAGSVSGNGWVSSIVTSASCSMSDVYAVINGPTHYVVDGDVIQIKSGTCSFSMSGITVPTGIGFTIIGAGGFGIPTGSTSTFLPDTTCSTGPDQTTLTAPAGASLFNNFNPNYGNSLARISCMNLIGGDTTSLIANIFGKCNTSGCPDLRMDNLTLTSWGLHSGNNSYAIVGLGNVFGVIDHNDVRAVDPAHTFSFAEIDHTGFMGIGAFGDNSWATSEYYGTNKYIFFENNTFFDTNIGDNEGGGGAVEGRGGMRVAALFNHFTEEFQLPILSWHGTETNGRSRSGRSFIAIGNTFHCLNALAYSGCGNFVGVRGGTGLSWGNTIDIDPSTGALSNLINSATFRRLASIVWGACDGSSVWDTNDGMTYYSDTVGSVAGKIQFLSGTGATFDVSWTGGTYTVTVANQGSGYVPGAPIKILGNHAGIGGTSPANDLTIRVLISATPGPIASNFAGAISWTGTAPVGTSSASGIAGDTGQVLVAGSGYGNGTYNGVSLTGGSGTGATANITVSGGSVTSVVLQGTGTTDYHIGDILSASAADIGGGGSGFQIPVSSVSNATGIGNGLAILKPTTASPGWTANTTYSPTGSNLGKPFSIHDVDLNTGTEIWSNSTNSLTLMLGVGGPGNWYPYPGDTIQILRATSCVDNAYHGAGILYSGIDGSSLPTSPIAAATNIVSPAYEWADIISERALDSTPIAGLGNSTIKNRDFYYTNAGQIANTCSDNPTNLSCSPFDGSTTIGMGYGLLSNMPATCTTGVGYGATNQGSWNTSSNGFGQGKLLICTATNTWTAKDVAYDYPHPLMSTGSTPSTQSFTSQPTNTITGNAISPFTITVNPAAATSITVSVTSGTCTFTGTATQTSDAMTGAATFNLTAGTVGTSCVLTAHNNTDGTIADVMSNNFNITTLVPVSGQGPGRLIFK